MMDLQSVHLSLHFWPFAISTKISCASSLCNVFYVHVVPDIILGINILHHGKLLTHIHTYTVFFSYVIRNVLMPNIDMEANKRARKAGYVLACSFSITYGISTVNVLKFQTFFSLLQEPSGSAVECLTQDRGVACLNLTGGVQWLSGRVLDSRLRGRGFETHRRHCVVVLEQDTLILA